MASSRSVIRLDSEILVYGTITPRIRLLERCDHRYLLPRRGYSVDRDLNSTPYEISVFGRAAITLVILCPR